MDAQIQKVIADVKFNHGLWPESEAPLRELAQRVLEVAAQKVELGAQGMMRKYYSHRVRSLASDAKEKQSG